MSNEQNYLQSEQIIEEMDVIKKLSDIIGQQGRDAQSQELADVLKYIAEMQAQLGVMTGELQGIRAQLAEMQKNQYQSETVVTYLYNNISKLSDQLSGAKNYLIDSAANAVNAFKEKGRAEMNKVLQEGISSAKDILEKIKYQMMELLPKIEKTINEIDSIGNELNQIGNSVANVERILSGKNTQDVSGESQGVGFTRALNIPLRKTHDILKNYIEGIDNIYNKLSKVSAELREPVIVDQKLKSLLNKYGYTDVYSLDGNIFIGGPAKVNKGFSNLAEVNEFVNGIDELCSNNYTIEQLQEAIEQLQEAMIPHIHDQEVEQINRTQNIVPVEAVEKSNDHPQYNIVYYEGDEKKSLYTDKLESGFEIIRNNNASLKDTDRCYVGIYNGESGKYVSSDIYLIKSGENITPVPLEFPKVKGKEAFARLTSEIKALGAKFDGKQWTVAKNISPDNLKKINDILARFDSDKIYLTLPAMGKEKFKILTEKLKEDGAKFDPVKKQWYITKACDKEKFNDYISGERLSVLGKLQEAKENVVATSGDGAVNKEVNREAAAR